MGRVVLHQIFNMMLRMKRKNVLNVAIGVCFMLLQQSIIAQDSTQNLTLADAINRAEANNKSVQLAGIDEQIAQSNYKQTNAIFLPQVGMSYTAMSTNNPLNAFGFKLQQKSITQADFNPDLLNHPSGTPDFSTQLSVQQPIVNLDMLYMRKGAAKQVELYQFKTKRTKEYVTYEVQKAYLQLQLAYDAVKVLEESAQTAHAMYQLTQNYFNQGLVQKSDVLNAQVHESMVTTNLANAKNNIKNASDYLSFLMGTPTGVVYTITDKIDDDTNITDITAKVPEARADFMAMKTAIEASKLMIKSSKMSYLPKLNAFGNYQLNDSRMLGFGANAYLAGIQLSWNIFNGNTTKNIITTKTLERNKLEQAFMQQKDQSQLELNKTIRDLQNARFEIKQQQTAIEQAAEALRILQNRYQQGLVKTTDVLMAETQLAQQKLGLAQAAFTYHSTRAYIQFLTATTH